ncbi:hypothetical protein [Alienimonas chondri]|nr:hypothetical protein [Alienimonas chondri]
MFASPPRLRPLPVPAAALGWAALLLALLIAAAAAAPWAVRTVTAAAVATAAAVWGWRSAREPWRCWIAGAPLAAWALGTFGWGGATVVAGAAWIALLGARTKPQPPRWGRPVAAGHSDQSVQPIEPEANGQLSDGFFPETFEPDEFESNDLELGEFESDEPEPDQWFSRTADAIEGELLVPCENGVGTAHVLFWPAFAAPPRVQCHPADGVGRVRPARALPQGVRFEVTRPDGETGPVRVCYEASV